MVCVELAHHTTCYGSWCSVTHVDAARLRVCVADALAECQLNLSYLLSQLYTVMSFSSILSFEMDSLEPTCLVPTWGYANNLVVQLLLPLIMAALVALWCFITYVMYKVKQVCACAVAAMEWPRWPGLQGPPPLTCDPD